MTLLDECVQKLMNEGVYMVGGMHFFILLYGMILYCICAHLPPPCENYSYCVISILYNWKHDSFSIYCTLVNTVKESRTEKQIKQKICLCVQHTILSLLALNSCALNQDSMGTSPEETLSCLPACDIFQLFVAELS